MIEDVGIGGEDPVRQPVLPDELPDSLDWVQLGRLGWKRNQGDVVWDHQVAGLMPAGLIEQEHGVGTGRNGLRDLLQVQCHGVGGAAGQDKPGALALGRADRAEDVGRRRPLVLGG